MTSGAEHVPKGELLLRVRTERDAVTALLASLPPAALLRSDAIGRWSVRDLLAHFVAHEQRALAEIAAARRGERLPSELADVDEFNAGAVLAWSALGPEEARAAWDQSHRLRSRPSSPPA